jgi:hypothetical protein
MKAVGVLSHLTPKAWPLVEGWIRSALERAKADCTAEDVREQLADTRMQLWLAWDGDHAKGCCITELVSTARGLCCNLVVVAGVDFKAWRPLIESIKAWAREKGCARLEASGRAGWERLVADDGWRKTRVVIEMDLQADG